MKNIEIEINQFFTPDELEQLANETNFIQRQGKITGTNFFDVIIFNNESLKDQSLNDLSIDLSEKYDVSITKQSLYDRFNNNAIYFIKRALEKLLNRQLDAASLVPMTKGFNRILIKDSTCFQIDESLAYSYQGSGGDGSAAAVRIQFEYDLLNGRINDLSVNAFNDQDATNSLETIELTEKGDLILRDLAYINLKVVKRLILTGAFFLARLQPNVKVFEKINGRFRELNFVQIRKYMKRHELSVFEKEIFIGAQDRIRVRLIIHLLPDEVINERMRKIKKNNKKKGRPQSSKEYKARASLNLFITNATEDQISTRNVYPLYRLRWQIELTFKIWKSLCKIDKIKKVKKERLECYIYGKLIIIIFAWRFLWTIARFMFSQEKKMISYFKAFKTLFKKKLDELRRIVFQRTEDYASFTINFYNISTKKHLLEKKRNKLTSIEVLITCLN